MFFSSKYFRFFRFSQRFFYGFQKFLMFWKEEKLLFKASCEIFRTNVIFRTKPTDGSTGSSWNMHQGRSEWSVQHREKNWSTFLVDFFQNFSHFFVFLNDFFMNFQNFWCFGKRRCPLLIAPRFKSWNLRSGISSPKPTGCCLGDLEAHLKIALLSQIGQSKVIF